MSSLEGPDAPVTDAERELAVGVLRHAAESGGLPPHDLDASVAQARLVATRGELQRVLADLSAGRTLHETLNGRPDPRHLGPGYSWDDPLTISATWETEKRLARWEVPPYLELHPVMSTIKLSFLAATPVSLEIDLSLMGGAGNTVLVIPQTWGVNVSRLKKGIGSIKCHVAERGAPGSPTIYARGNTMLGTFKARYASRFDTWQLQRALRRFDPARSVPELPPRR